MTVLGIRGRRIGVVGSIHEECFEVRRPKEDGGDVICLKAESLFTVDRHEGVTLVCAKEEVLRYAHVPHPSSATEAGAK